MSVLRTLWERHKNPLSWVMRPLFATVLFYGLWIHDWVVIGIAIFSLSTSWFWFPKPKHPPVWAEKFIDKELEWLKNPLKNAVGIMFAIAGMGILTWALWNNNVVVSFVLLGITIVGKIIWSSLLERSVAKPLTILVLGTYLVAVIVLLLFLAFLKG